LVEIGHLVGCYKGLVGFGGLLSWNECWQGYWWHNTQPQGFGAGLDGIGIPLTATFSIHTITRALYTIESKFLF